MKENELNKEKIRERYKGINPDVLDVIPAKPQEKFQESINEKRVAVYVRVSTDDPRQTSSYELQKNHYLDLVDRHPNWKLVDIYADEGITGTSIEHRIAFVRMLEDCQAHKIDFIVTKSVSRFSRNLIDSIGCVRKLSALQPPVGVFFETENIYTLTEDGEMRLAFMSIMAQEESHKKSEIMNASIDMRFKRGIFLTPPLLGYDQDEEGNLVVNEDEAKTVRLTFFMYLYGYTCAEIAETLTNYGRKTKKNNTKWSANSILQILQNERHCGDVLARKTWTPNFLDHKSRKNKQDRTQYRHTDHHEAIISRDDYIAVQRLINNAKFGNKGILPKLHVIPDGALKGFVPIHPKWANFSAADYHAASISINNAEDDDQSQSNNLEVEAKHGDFDLRGFEIARSQFFDIYQKNCITFSNNNILFSTECVRKFNKILYIEMLVHPSESLIAVRPCSKESKNAIQWAYVKDGTFYSKRIFCTAYIKTLFEIFGWRFDCKYRVRGIHKQKDNDIIAIFDMKETEIFIPQSVLKTDQLKLKENEIIPDNIQPFTAGPKKDIMAYPLSWADGFGSNFYIHEQEQELIAINQENNWDIKNDGLPFSDSQELNVTGTEIVSQEIELMLDKMKREVSGNG